MVWPTPRAVLPDWIARRRVELSRSPAADPRTVAPAARDFHRAVTSRRATLAVIAEVARASPEEGDIGWSHELDALIDAAESAPVAAFAAAADPVLCRGSYAECAQVANQVGDPVIVRDMVVSREQLFRARLANADALLLTAAALRPHELRALAEAAGNMNMAAPVEVASSEELAIAAGSGVRSIVLSAYGPGGALALEPISPLLDAAPTSMAVLVRGPFTTPAQVAPLRGRADAIWVAGTWLRAPDPARLLADLVAAGEE